jgi:hypothetical protein
MSRALTSRDAEFIQNLQQDMVDVFNRMAPGLLAMLDKNATEANALAARATYSEKALWKTLETFAQKITSNVLPLYGPRLKGEFDDPRVVDRRLELDEQDAFERTHTIEEVRQQYYHDDPIGDERDRLLVAEIKTKATSFGNDVPQGDGSSQVTMDNTGQDTGAEDMATKAALDDLQRWRTMALRGKATKAANFTSAYIPADLIAQIKRDLNGAKDKDQIAALFASAAKSLQPQPQVNPMVLLRGIEAGVRALEISGNR